ncbi:MAG: MBL fold metallo-hydrolase [Dehalococcoidia bacterium]|nr:MBL fold metallo-hydrolase [Dehalococcoidia bacterium]
MKIKWLGHACFLIESAAGVRVITDPYEAGGFGGAIGYGPIQETAAVVLVSHEHSDHSYVAGLPGNPMVIQGPGTCHVSGIEFNGVACFHDSSGGRERGKNTMYTFKMDEVHVCHVGDLGHQLSETQIEALGPVDVLLTPVGGKYTLDAAGATLLAQRLSVRVVIPMHFRTDRCTLPIAGVEDFLKGKERVRKAGSSDVEISQESMPAGMEIIVLEPAL